MCKGQITNFIESKYFQAEGINESPVLCHGIVKDMDIRIGQYSFKTNLYVLSIKPELVIGRNLCKEHKVKIDFDNMKISFGPKTLHMMASVSIEQGQKQSEMDKNIARYRTFQKSVKDNDIKRVQEMVAQNPEIVNAIVDRCTGIHLSVTHNHHNLTAWLARKGASLITRDGKGANCLHLCATGGNPGMAHMITNILKRKNKINAINAVDSKGRTPLIYASAEGHVELVELFVECEADIEFKDNEECTPLLVAAKNSFTECAEILIKMGANLNATDARGNSALHFASFRQNTPLVKHLLSNKDIEISTNDQGFTPKMMANDQNIKSMIQLEMEKREGRRQLLATLRQKNSTHSPFMDMKKKNPENDGTLVGLLSRLKFWPEDATDAILIPIDKGIKITPGSYRFEPLQSILQANSLESYSQLVWVSNNMTTACFINAGKNDINLAENTVMGTLFQPSQEENVGVEKVVLAHLNMPADSNGTDLWDENCILPQSDEGSQLLPPSQNDRAIKLTSENGNRISIPINNKNVSITDIEKLQRTMEPYGHVFATCAQETRIVSNFEFCPEVIEDKIMYEPPNRWSPNQLQPLMDFVNDGLSNGTIEEGSSPHNTRLVQVTKKDGGNRWCFDLSRKNANLKRVDYPIVKYEEIFDSLGGNSFFTVLDIQSAYSAILIQRSKRHLFAFRTPFGSYQPRTMPFGLQQSSGIFLKLMDVMLRGIKYQGVCNFVDDVILWSPNIEHHCRIIEDILKRFDKSNFRISAKKVVLASEELPYLGMIVSKDGLKPSPEKTAAIDAIEAPKNLKELQSILGQITYYNRFIPGCSVICYPLYQLLQKDMTFEWTEEHDAALSSIKNILKSDQVMIYPNFNKSFTIGTDASGYGMAWSLEQEDEEGNLKPISFAGRTLQGAEKRYAIVDLEALCVVCAVKYYSSYVDNGIQFTIRTDNRALRWVYEGPHKTRNPKLLRYALEPQNMNFKVQHVKGAHHGHVDAISRYPYRWMSKMEDILKKFNPRSVKSIEDITKKLRIDEDNQLHILNMKSTEREIETSPGNHHETDGDDIPKFMYSLSYMENNMTPALCQLSKDLKLQQGEIEREEEDEVSDMEAEITLKKLQQRDKICQEIRKFLDKTATPRELSNSVKLFASKCTDINGILYFQNKETLFKVAPQSIVPRLISECHEDLITHPSSKTVISIIKEKWRWPGMTEIIKDFVDSCIKCQLYKHPKIPKQPIKMIQRTGLPWQHIAADVSGPWPKTTTLNRFVLVFKCLTSKYVEMFALKSVPATTVAQILCDNIFARFGICQTFLTDLGSNFQSSVVVQVCKMLNVKKKFTLPYTPSTNGQAERFMQSLNIAIFMVSMEHKRSWDTFLPFIQSGYNQSPNKALGNISPHEYMYGYRFPKPSDNIKLDGNHEKMLSKEEMLSKTEIYKKFEYLRNKASENAIIYREQCQKSANMKAKEVEYKPGMKVYTIIPTTGLKHAKTKPRFEGPFEIKEANNFYLVLSQENGEEFKINRNKVKLAKTFQGDIPMDPFLTRDAHAGEQVSEDISPTCRPEIDDTDTKEHLITNGKIYKEIASMDQNSRRFLVEDSNGRISKYDELELEDHIIKEFDNKPTKRNLRPRKKISLMTIIWALLTMIICMSKSVYAKPNGLAAACMARDLD